MSEVKKQLRIIPPHLRQLQRPWFPVDTYPKVEHLIRFGGKVEDVAGRKMRMNWMSGGDGTELWDQVGERTFMDFIEHSKDQYFGVTDKDKSEEMLSYLYQFLTDRGVQLIGDPDFGPSPALMNHDVLYGFLHTLSLLPDSHFGHPHFKRLQLGGWGGGAAKCSEFADPEVRVFEFATNGPIRNLWALTLHEIGHSFGANLTDQYYEALDKARRRLRELGASYGVDYLIGEEERQEHYLFSTGEFIADTYLMYVTQGAFTKEGLACISDAWEGASPDMLSRHHNFLESIDPRARRIWDAIWKLYRKCFEGIEYV